MRLTQPKTRLTWQLCAGAAVLFLFFLIETAPHQIHHFFDQAEAAQCVVFSVAQGWYLKTVSAISFPNAEGVIQKVLLFTAILIPDVPSSPFSSRSPPLA